MTYTMNVIEGQIQSDGSVLGPEQTLNQSIAINVRDYARRGVPRGHSRHCEELRLQLVPREDYQPAGRAADRQMESMLFPIRLVQYFALAG